MDLTSRFEHQSSFAFTLISLLLLSVKYANGGHPKVSVLGSSTLSAQSTDQNVTSWVPSGRENGSKYSCVVPSSI
jgi:hypothetical protein